MNLEIQSSESKKANINKGAIILTMPSSICELILYRYLKGMRANKVRKRNFVRM